MLKNEAETLTRLSKKNIIALHNVFFAENAEKGF